MKNHQLMFLDKKFIFFADQKKLKITATFAVNER